MSDRRFSARRGVGDDRVLAGWGLVRVGKVVEGEPVEGGLCAGESRHFEDVVDLFLKILKIASLLSRVLT